MSEREIKNLLDDIYEAVMKIISYTKDMSFDDFMQDEKTVDAVVRILKLLVKHQKEFPIILKRNILK